MLLQGFFGSGCHTFFGSRQCHAIIECASVCVDVLIFGQCKYPPKKANTLNLRAILLRFYTEHAEAADFGTITIANIKWNQLKKI